MERERLQYTYKTIGTCSSQISVVLDSNGVIESVVIKDGCKGNTTGISALVKGMKAEDVILRCKGINCGSKGTSCPDQLSQALLMALDELKKEA